MSAEPVAVNGSLIEARDLWRTYSMGAEEIHALRGVSFTIAAGEYLAVHAPTGSPGRPHVAVGWSGDRG